MQDWMRHTVESTLGPAKAYRRTRSETRTRTGGTTFTWADGDWSYCTVATLSGDESELAGRLASRATVTCRVSISLDVDPPDRIRIEDTGTDELDGEWEVVYVAVASMPTDRLLYLARV